MKIPLQSRRNRCFDCSQRYFVEKFFRRHFSDINRTASRCYLFSIPKIEERTHARCGEWIIASYQSLGDVCFHDEKTIKKALKLLAARGLIEYKPGTTWGFENTTRVRRKTVDEIKTLARRCVREKHQIYSKKQQEIKLLNNTLDTFSPPRLADRLKEMV